MRVEWGPQALRAVCQPGDVLIVVDVLSFSTCVDIACAHGAVIVPCAHKDARAAALAAAQGAELAVPRGQPGLSLSPASLLGIAAGTRLVLPSPNGAALSALAAGTHAGPVLAGAWRNLDAVARHAAALARPVVVVAAGERWPDGSLRPAVEDLLCAGALVERLPGTRSPEAEVAAAAWCGLAPRLAEVMEGCASALELRARGHAADVTLAMAVNASGCVPRLVEGAYRDVSRDGPTAAR